MSSTPTAPGRGAPGADASVTSEARGTVPVGAAVERVDVPTGTPMAGFAARTSPSTGVHDPTTVRALALGPVVIVSVDVCVLHEDTCELIAARIREAAPVEVIVAATHTHSGPSIGCGRVGPSSAIVHEGVIDAAVRAGVRARQAQVPARVLHARVHGTDVARDRRHLDRSIDPPLVGLRFVDVFGAEVASLVSYPCHPVVLDARNTLISGDYVAPLRERLEEQWAAPCLFLTGAAGDVNTGHAASASFRTAAAEDRRTFAEAHRIGATLADALLAAEWSELSPTGPVTCTVAPVTLPYQELTTEQVAQQARAFAAGASDPDPGTAELMRLWHQWATSWEDRWGAAEPVEPWRGRVAHVDLGGALSVLTLPGEPFLAVAEHLHSAVSSPVLVAAYCDGVPGYLPTADAYPEGGYEVDDAHRYYGMPAPFARGCAELVRDAAADLLKEN